MHADTADFLNNFLTQKAQNDQALQSRLNEISLEEADNNQNTSDAIMQTARKEEPIRILVNLWISQSALDDATFDPYSAITSTIASMADFMNVDPQNVEVTLMNYTSPAITDDYNANTD